jgi:hypothetical protein
VALERDPRGKMITLDPDTGAMEPAVLRYVTQAPGGTVGVYAAVLVEGVVARATRSGSWAWRDAFDASRPGCIQAAGDGPPWPSSTDHAEKDRDVQDQTLGSGVVRR